MNAFSIKLDENRSVTGKAHGKLAVMFQFRNGACVTRLALSHECMQAMRAIADALQAVEENKRAAKATRQEKKAGKS